MKLLTLVLTAVSVLVQSGAAHSVAAQGSAPARSAPTSAPAAGSIAGAPTEESPGPNSSIVRWSEGEYVYRSLKDRAERGWERFSLTVHPDGSRSMLMWHGLRARSAQFTVSLRSEKTFRPLEAYVSYWNDGKYKGSATMFVSGPTLYLISRGAWGTHRERVPVPERGRYHAPASTCSARRGWSHRG